MQDEEERNSWVAQVSGMKKGIRMETLKLTLWLIYAMLIVVIWTVSMAMTMAMGTPTTWMEFVCVSAVTLAYLTGVAGYVCEERYLKRDPWRILFWFAAITLLPAVYGIVMALKSHGELKVGLTAIALQLPLLYALWRYSSKNNLVWQES